jgi:hypothetical protein
VWRAKQTIQQKQALNNRPSGSKLCGKRQAVITFQSQMRKITKDEQQFAEWKKQRAFMAGIAEPARKRIHGTVGRRTPEKRVGLRRSKATVAVPPAGCNSQQSLVYRIQWTLFLPGPPNKENHLRFENPTV